MRVVIAPDSFKESLAAAEVCRAVEEGLREWWPDLEVVCVPMADGGEGTMAALVAATGGRVLTARVEDPLGRSVVAEFGLLGDGRTAVVEMAAASGLALLGAAERDPLRTSTYGTGQLIAAALDVGVERIIVGLGGSATVDGGVGAARALGAEFLDEAGRPIGPGGGALECLHSIDLSRLDRRLRGVRVEAACDVVNPLLGPEGAARVFAPQKGADHVAVEKLERGLKNLAEVVRRDLDLDISAVPGGGAAGGLGAGLLAFLGATLRPGVELVIEAVGLERVIEGSDLVITGEGRLDGQSVQGKTVWGVVRLARRRGVPVVALVGALGEGWERMLQEGLTACFALPDRPMGLEWAVRETSHLLRATAGQLARLLRAMVQGGGGKGE